ncbi:GntR family transcriptional regulator [Agromyces subbeticus]|uniref:GntR family transcriptional regulator n=1 Tax=Agromyces subbeticus TaxID=293890 RepID=UPI0003B773F0|nr:GntR family transcriptional regulator [Agromyces subbeticus]
MSNIGPLYSRVERSLVERIGVDLLPGDQLPTEDELIAEFRVSRITVRRAVSNLVARGVAISRRGKGTFVASPRIEQPLTELTGFVEDMHAAGLAASALVLSSSPVAADAEVARHLDVPVGSKVVFIERVRLGNGIPISFDETYLLPDIGAKVANDDLATEPIFSLLEQKYGVPLIEAEYRLESLGAAPHIAAALQIPAGDATFRIERTSFTTGGRPVDYERLHYRGDAIAFVTRLQRAPH